MTIEAEIAVLGSCLVEQSAVNYSLAALQPEHFTDQRHQILFKSFAEMKEANIGIDLVTVYEWIEPKWRTIVSMPFLLELTSKVPTAVNVGHYCEAVKKDFYGRKLAEAYLEAQKEPLDADWREKIKKLWDSFLQGKNSLMDLGDDLMDYADRLVARMNGKDRGIFTGFPGFDSFTGGLRPGVMVTIAARTSKGKTTYLMGLADKFIMAGKRVLFYSAEMGYDELVDRMVSTRSAIPLTKIRAGKLDKAEYGKVIDVLGIIKGRPLVVNDIGRLTIEGVRAGIEICKPDIVMVDYIQRFIPPGDGNRAAFFSDVANEMKSIAREKKLVMFVTSQLNRSGQENGKEREPVLADLKESGGIEEASDIVMFLHSKNSDDRVTTRLFDFIIAKQRNGPLGRIKYVFFKSTVAFQEQEEGDE